MGPTVFLESKPQTIGQQYERSARDLLWAGSRNQPSQRLTKAIRWQRHPCATGEKLAKGATPHEHAVESRC
jgi:hypothetical protein